MKLKEIYTRVVVDQGPVPSSVLSTQTTGLTLFYMGEKYPAGVLKSHLQGCPQHPRLALGTTPWTDAWNCCPDTFPGRGGLTEVTVTLASQPATRGPVAPCKCPLCNVNSIIRN